MIREFPYKNNIDIKLLENCYIIASKIAKKLLKNSKK